MQTCNCVGNVQTHPKVSFSFYSMSINIHNTWDSIVFLEKSCVKQPKYTKTPAIPLIEPVLKWQAAGRLLFWEVTLIGLNRCSSRNAAGVGGAGQQLTAALAHRHFGDRSSRQRGLTLTLSAHMAFSLARSAHGRHPAAAAKKVLVLTGSNHSFLKLNYHFVTCCVLKEKLMC